MTCVFRAENAKNKFRYLGKETLTPAKLGTPSSRRSYSSLGWVFAPVANRFGLGVRQGFSPGTHLNRKRKNGSKPRRIFQRNSFIYRKRLHLSPDVLVRYATVGTSMNERLWHIFRQRIHSQILLSFTDVLRRMKRAGTILRFALEAPVDMLRHRRKLYCEYDGGKIRLRN